MEQTNAIREKSMNFAIRIVNLYKHIRNEENVMSKQVLRSGTSIGANIAEAYRAESNNDFIHKLSVSRKEILLILPFNKCSVKVFYARVCRQES